MGEVGKLDTCKPVHRTTFRAWLLVNGFSLGMKVYSTGLGIKAFAAKMPAAFGLLWNGIM